MLFKVMDNKSCYNLDNEDILREVIINIRLERIDIQERVTAEVLLNSEVIRLVMSSEFARKQEFKLKKIERLIYVGNADGSFNKEEPIEYTVEVNIYYQGYKERIEIDVISSQKQSVILGMLWLAHHNPKINWRIEKIKMKKCPEKYSKQ